MHLLDTLLGLHRDSADLTFGQMSLRALVVFLWGIVIVRCGDRRLLGRNAGFDVLLVVILGSVLSRGINGQAAFFPTLGVCAVLVFLHHLLAFATLHSDGFSRLVKGTPRTLVRNGEADREEMRRTKFTPDDLDENLRLNGNVSDPAQVREARLERNGTVSVIAKDG
ncbi:MAG: putative rane protein [Verrucomicrobia bacterium]|nr:putative rane protein [Verrucomicrobiota bacterium]